jgi:hypothetical protein
LIARRAVLSFFFRNAAGITANELVDPSAYLEEHNFVLISRQSSRAAMLKSERWHQRV